MSDQSIEYLNESDVEIATGGGLGTALHNTYTNAVGSYLGCRNVGLERGGSAIYASTAATSGLLDGLAGGKRVSTSDAKQSVVGLIPRIK